MTKTPANRPASRLRAAAGAAAAKSEPLLWQPPTAPIVHAPMHEQVYDRIRESFASGQVAPGQRIVIRDLARAMGTSMMPVRDALRRLEAENAVVLTQGRMLAVPYLSAAEYQELCTIRVALESTAVQEAAKRITPSELDQLCRFAQLMEDAVDAKDLPAVALHNRNFHGALYAASRRPLLIRIIESLWLRVGPQMSHATRHDVLGYEVLQHGYHPHRLVIAALRDGNGTAAATAIAYDITRAAQIIVDYLQKIEHAASEPQPAKIAAKEGVRQKSIAKKIEAT